MLGTQFPLLHDTHAGGHLWNDLTGWSGDPHLSPFHLAGYIAIGGGFWLIAAAWRHLHTAAQHDKLATTGPYAWVRHPQYDGLLLVMIGFLLQRPTIPTLIMLPIMVYVYVRLARSEEREVAEKSGDQWAAYAARTPTFWPRRPPRHRSPAHSRTPTMATGAAANNRRAH
ncbi:isoprenylcysteine carboxylmethyltransferase family protein [Streptomyces sp. Rer75]|uniref:methyltransferase family protein n=1 Tax=Streptomyces sp. Rer75 TaxID=2750011 RepID=UPI00211F37B8|nr:isoprenylcysteine carboxylmethyltransferase family protein [Streptomyces sp. Rer75]